MTEQTLSTYAQSPVATTDTRDVVLRLNNLTKRYGQRTAVNNLNLSIKRGEIFGFLGPNGAGKTTTIRMIFGLATPTAGTIEIFGQNALQQRANVLPRVGALIETPALYLYMSGRNNLRAVAATLGGVSDARIDEVLKIVGLYGRQKDRVKTYSLGMKQRLGVAIALLQDPDLLILDEPANGLDPAGIVEMRDLMHSLSEEGKTVLISSHLLSEIQQICTRVAIINLGQLVTETTIDDLVSTKGEYEVQLEQPEQALALIKQQSWGTNATINEAGKLVTVAPQNRGQDLNLFLVQAGFVPETIAVATRDLEQVFLQLTSSEQTGVK
ncbi:ABC transporter ATP-binding protein [Ktedonobacteria bacterium brp13]|nr:ABC transporter ATP-binding protein [Ktedonobacteria bacterium brp13]